MTDAMNSKPPQIEFEVIISNAQGLHARPVMRFVDLSAKFSSDIRIHKDNLVVDGKSPMEMMLLEAIKGTRLRLVACGEDAAEAIKALAQLVDGKFGEE